MDASSSESMADMINADQVSKWTDTAIELAMSYGPRLILAIVVLILGLWIINRFVRVMGKGMERSNTEPTLARFLCNLTSIGLKALLLISVASMVGIATTSFVAVLGAAGLAIGLALQGSLANFAGGVLILMFRPYKVGDFVEAQGVMGTVAEIQIFNTILKTPDNKRIIVPNGAASNGIITNFSAEATRRVDFVFGVGYEDDLQKVKHVLEEILSQDERILKDPAPTIGLLELADSSINFAVRPWVKTMDYWDVYFDLMEEVKMRFDQEGISIPFPQRDVHMFSQE